MTILNYLAHTYLSGKSHEILIGNFIGDGVKGKELHNYPAEITRGIKLHREIDRYTDNHGIVELSKARLRSRHGKFSGVIVDLFYDHFLAANWTDHSPIPLNKFTKETYSLLFRNFAILPKKIKIMLPYMAKSNWMLNYSNIEGLGRALTGLSNRTRFDSNMDTATEELVEYYDLFHSEFKEFFPQLIKYANDYIQNES